MPQAVKPGYGGLLSKWLSNPAMLPAPLQNGWTRARNGFNAVMNYQPLRNDFMCNLAKNVWTGASRLSGTSLNTPTEKAMMGRYFGGGGGSYRLSPEEWNAAVRYYNTYGKNVLVGPPFPTADGGRRQNVNFTGTYGDERLDGLLGTATGYFDKDGNMTGWRDVFDFDDRPRGTGLGNGLPGRTADYLAGKLVGLPQQDAEEFCPAGSNPVTIKGGSRR